MQAIIRIDIIPHESLAQALTMVQRVFTQFVAPDYTPEGIATFHNFLHDPEAISALRFYGAYEEDTLVGILATRGSSHISLFFVEPCYQMQGVGRALLSAAIRDCTSDVLTVNSSPFAVEIYQKLGFHALSDEQVTDGIRFTPMKCDIKQ
jgi:GNAT superfamily N-acetyltransferase